MRRPHDAGPQPGTRRGHRRTLRALPEGERRGTLLAAPFGTSQHLVSWLRAAAGCDDGWGLLGRQLVAIVSVIAFSFVLSRLIAKAVDLTVGFRSEEEYGSVPGADRERAYDFRTAERLGALVAGEPAGSDDELVRQIATLLRARRDAG